MKSLELEKILKRLEKLDIQEWEFHGRTDKDFESVSAKNNGLEFYIKKQDYGVQTEYSLSIRNIGDDFWLVDYSTLNETVFKKRAPKKLIKDFYEQIITQIKGYKKIVFQKKLDEFLKE